MKLALGPLRRLSGLRSLARGRLRDTRAQALVETVLVLPVLLALAAAAVDGGQLMVAAETATSAAAAGARAAATDVAQGAGAAQILSDAQAAATQAAGTLTCTGSAAPSGCIAVTAGSTSDGSPTEVVTVYLSPTLILPVGGPPLVTGTGVAAP